MRNTLIATIAALAAMACTASAAQALTVYSGVNGFECPAVSASGATVTGGCPVEDMQGTFDLYSNGSPFASGTADFDLRVGPDAHFYAVDQIVSTTPYARVACDDASGARLPWPRVTSPIPGTQAVAVCLRAAASGPGSPGTTVTVPFTLAFNQYTNLISMTQADTPSFGLRNAFFENTGSTAEIFIQ
jgi:hypothetical protein